MVESCNETLNTIAEKLNSVIKEHTEEIKEIDIEIKNLLEKKANKQAQLKEALTIVQKNAGVQSYTKKRKNKEGSIKELILKCLGEQELVKSSEIKKYLEDNGRGQVSPGTELNRLVKTGIIKNVERGIYSLNK